MDLAAQRLECGQVIFGKLHQRCRRCTEKNAFKRILCTCAVFALVPVLNPLFLSAFRRADALALAMACRCYRGGDGRTRLKVLRCTRQDYIDLAVCIVCFVIILSSRLVFPNY